MSPLHLFNSFQIKHCLFLWELLRGVAEMSGADEELWGDEEDDAMLAMMDSPDQVLSLLILVLSIFRVAVVVQRERRIYLTTMRMMT